MCPRLGVKKLDKKEKKGGSTFDGIYKYVCVCVCLCKGVRERAKVDPKKRGCTNHRC